MTELFLLTNLLIMLKLISSLCFLIALLFSVRCYSRTKTTSYTWLYIMFATATAFTLTSIRFIKEFLPLSIKQEVIDLKLLEIIKVELIPIFIVFLLAAAFTIKKEKGFPVIIPVREDGISLREGVTKIHAGYTYIIEDKQGGEGIDIFLNALAGGFKGLHISRKRRSHIEYSHQMKRTPCVWLTEMSSEGYMTIGPNLEKIFQMIKEFIEESDGGVIFLEGLDYLIEHNTFERTLFFLERTTDRISMSKCSLIIPLDPQVLNRKEKTLIEREADIIHKGGDNG